MSFNISDLRLRPFFLILLSTLVIPFTDSLAQTKHFSSGDSRVSLVELFTSEGCSSCPPAEKWLGSLQDDPQLWKRFVPVAFHVDYWDYIGWKDPFASREYGLRQRQYRQLGNIRTVYTPGMLLNGKEWQKWRYSRSVPASDGMPGILDVALNDNDISAVFSPFDRKINEWQLNIAVLGFDLESNVRSGENAGRRLVQDFVVLGYLRKNSSNGRWQMKLPDVKDEYAEQIGLAVWVNKKGEQTPLQATGGWLNKKKVQHDTD